MSDERRGQGPDDIAAFKKLQGRLADLFARIMPDPDAPRTVVVIPSLTLDDEVLARITGIVHYEERLLPLLFLLRLPRTRVVYATSQTLPDAIVDYYLDLLPGPERADARARLVLLSAEDGSRVPLTEKILSRPDLMARLDQAVGERASAHMTCFNVAVPERRLAVALGLPIYGCDPDLLPLGSKSGRRIFREAGIDLPEGMEDLSRAEEVTAALAGLKRAHPEIDRAVVKLNEGFSGEGNALFSFQGAPEDETLPAWIADRLDALAFEAKRMDWPTFAKKLGQMGGIVEMFVEGENKRSPSVQCRVLPDGGIEVISTHDQVLGGPGGQVFLGCSFPADPAYRLAIQDEGRKAAAVLARYGVLGRFAIDFISVRDKDGWRHQAIEINLRKGGTTHPFLALQYLTGGSFDPQTGEFSTRAGEVRSYFATDNLESARYRGLLPEALIGLVKRHGLHFDAESQTGVVFHMLGAVTHFGKLGLVCVAETPQAAEALYGRTVDILDGECCD